MSSRQEEKQRRREEREAQERKDRAAAQRSRRLQMVGGVVVVAAIAVVAAILISSSGGDDGDGPKKASSGPTVAIPKAGENAKPDKLEAAAKAAGCTVKDYPSFGQGHTQDKVTYKSNPPTSGQHNPTAASDGIYDPGNTPAKENFVHSLEHGRIQFQYKPGTPKEQVAQLETLFGEKTDTSSGVPSENGGYTQLFENTTNMPYAVAGVAWQHVVGCRSFNPRIFDALRAFRARYTLQAPEKVLQAE